MSDPVSPDELALPDPTLPTVLVVDAEEDVLRFVEVNLRLDGFNVVPARDGVEALSLAAEHRPDLVLLEVALPGLDGFEVCRRLGSDYRTESIPVIFLTSKALTVDKVVGLTAGGDDYILKPFDPMELLARVRRGLKRVTELRSLSPLTGLPGNDRIIYAISQRLDRKEGLVLLYCDLSDFKAFNDHYGFVRGDRVIRLTARVLTDATFEVAGHDGFVGHVGGDDFMIVCPPEVGEGLAQLILASFDHQVPAMYDPEDAVRGGVEGIDRDGNDRLYPLATMTLAGARANPGEKVAVEEIVGAATRIKRILKRDRTRGSVFRIETIFGRERPREGTSPDS